MKRSRVCESTDVTEIGLKSLGYVGFGILGISVITAVFHWHRTVPSSGNWLNSRASGAAKIGTPTRKNQASIESSPVAVGRNVSSFQNTSSSWIQHRSSDAESFGLGGCSVVLFGRYGCIVIIEHLRHQPVDAVAGLIRRPSNDLSDFGPGIIGTLSGIDFVQPFRTLREIMVRTRAAITPASSVHPTRISRFFRRSIAFTAGVTYGGSDDVTVVSRSG